jgi:hypothetical protein
VRLLVYIIYCHAFIICILLLADNADVAYKFILNFLSFIRRLLAFQYEILLAMVDQLFWNTCLHNWVIFFLNARVLNIF